jgi:site-specific recombinase XerD
MTRWRFPPRQSVPSPPSASSAQEDGDTRPLADSAIVGRGPNIDTLAKKFFDYLLVEQGVSLRTRARYAHAIRRLKDWARWKRKNLRDLTLADCRRWRLNMRGNGLAPSTVNTNLLAARMFFRFLFFDRYLKGNPFEAVELLPKVESERRWLSIEEIDRLFANA